MKIKFGCISQCFFPWLLYSQYKQSWTGQAGQMLAWADKFYLQDLAKGGIVPPLSIAVWEDRHAYSGRQLLALVQLFSTVLELTQAGEVLVTEVV